MEPSPTHLCCESPRYTGPREYVIAIQDSHGAIREPTTKEYLILLESLHHTLVSVYSQDSVTVSRVGMINYVHRKLQESLEPLLEKKESLRLFALPPTLYQLIFVREYLFQRVNLPFSARLDDPNTYEMDPDIDVCLCLPAFYCDHTSIPAMKSSLDFFDRMRQYTSSSNYLEAHRYLNSVILDILCRNGSIAVDSSLCSCGPCYDVPLDICKNITEQMLKCIELISEKRNTTISSNYLLWPLSDENLISRMDAEGIEDEDAISCWRYRLAPLFDKLKTARKHARSIPEEALVSMLSPIYLELFTLLTRDHISAIIVECLFPAFHKNTCPIWMELITPGDALTAFVLQYGLQAAADFSKLVDRTDSLVYCARKSNFINERIIYKVLDVECSVPTSGEDELILMRATSLPHNIETPTVLLSSNCLIDNTAHLSNRKKFQAAAKSLLTNPCGSHSISFGASLFGGIIYDRTANCYELFKRKDSTSSYAIRLPLSKLHEALELFWIPPVSGLLQLYCIGEFFHPRSKVFIDPRLKDKPEYFVSGILKCSYKSCPDFLVNYNENIVEKYRAFLSCLRVTNLFEEQM